MSPKLANSGMTARRRLRFDVLRGFVDLGAQFKFVVVEPEDLDEVGHIAAKADIPPTSVWIMAEGISPKTIAARTAGLADDVVAARLEPHDATPRARLGQQTRPVIPRRVCRPTRTRT